MRKVLLGLALFSAAYGEQVVSSQALCQYGTPEGTPANLVFTLDYSGSMSWNAYVNYYDPHRIYLGYFDPFGVYVLRERDGYFIWEKAKEVYQLPQVWRDKHDWVQEGDIFIHYYSGNYLNYLYTRRIDLLRALLTGGKVKVLTGEVIRGCALKISYSDDVIQKFHSQRVREAIEQEINNLPFVSDNGGQIVIELPIPCWMTTPLNWAISAYYMAKNMASPFYKHWQHKICHIIPDHWLRATCKKADDLNAETEVQREITNRYFVIPLADGTYLKMEDAFTFDGTSLSGLLQKLEDRTDRPRVGGVLFSDQLKAYEYPSYIYDDFIKDINTTSPQGATYTGETFERVKEYFASHNGTDTDPYEFPVKDSNGNEVLITVNDAKNWNFLYSDGEWNGRVDPAVVAYDMWKGGYADLVSSLEGNQNVETYSFAMFLNQNDYGYRAMQNIAIFGGFTDKDGNKKPKGYENYFSNSTINQCQNWYFDDINSLYYRKQCAQNNGQVFYLEIGSNYYQYICKTHNCFDSRLVNPPVEADTIGEWYVNGRIKNFFGEEKIAKLYFNTYKLFANNIANYLEQVYCGEEPAIVPIPEQPVNLIKEVIDNLQVLKENRVDTQQVKAIIAYALEEIALTQTGSIRQYLNQLAEQVLQSASIDEAVAKAKQAVLNAAKQQVEIAEENPTVTNLQTVAQTAHHVAKFNHKLDTLATQLEQQVASNSSTNSLANNPQVQNILNDIKQALQTGKILLWLEY